MARDDTRDKLLEAATREFEERGFDGARVDRIARRARANKAMIYYHFGAKRALYQAVLVDLFGPVRESIRTLSSGPLPPRERLGAFYAGIIGLFVDAPTLPSLMVREVLAGGEHMDRGTAGAISEIVAFVRSCLEEGARAGTIRPVNPLFFHLTMIAPILFFFMGTSFRQKVLPQIVPGSPLPTPEDLARHVEETLARSLDPMPKRS